MFIDINLKKVVIFINNLTVLDKFTAKYYNRNKDNFTRSLTMDLKYKRKNVYKEADGNELKQIYDFAEGYKKFLDTSKTERDASETAKKLAEEKGFKPFSFSEKLKAGDKRYFLNRGKNIFLISVGKEDVAKDGVRIMVAHVDSPRLDLKPNPMYEEAGLCYFKTHYYGGIKKYQYAR